MGDNKGLDEDLEIEESEEPTEYDESTWGKKIDGQYVIDGFKFKGKQSFKEPREYLERLMVRGAKGEINGSKYKILDARLKGIETEVDLQIEIENAKAGIENRGTAVIKLYGPNKRKENSVTVTKFKKSDIKFVSIIAQKIIRPLIKQSLDLQENGMVSKQETVIKCGKCDKTFNTNRGLKGHNTKIHEGRKRAQLEVDSKPGTHLCVEDEADEDIGGEKLKSYQKEEKKYSSKCNQCDYEIKTKRKYELIQNGLKHKEECKKNNFNCKESHNRGSCNVCGFVAKSEPNIKRHLRDKHNIMSVSTSPPLKKTKVRVELSDEEMEVDSNEIIDLVEKQENMEIDSIEKQRSIMMDVKVIAKAKKIEEEEKSFQNKRKLKELKDKENEEIEKEKLKKLAKQKKQKVKDEKKRIRKRSIKTEKLMTNAVPNIKPIPENISHLVEKGDMLYVVPGDGSCAPSSASAFLFKDEVFGIQLKKKINKFIAEHWDKKYKFKTQCSETSPFIRKIGGGGEVFFTDPEKLVEYLRKSEEAAYMLSDSEDLAVISDMFQVNIKIITTKGPKDENPTVNWILPDEDMKDHADLKHVELNEMVLYHENDLHFNLIVSEGDDLVTKGSLSFRSNLGPFMKNVDKTELVVNNIEANNDDIVNEEASVINENKNLKDQLKKLTEKVKFLEKDYQSCEEELKNKTAECEKLKIQVKSQEEIINLGHKVHKDKATMEGPKMIKIVINVVQKKIQKPVLKITKKRSIPKMKGLIAVNANLNYQA